MRNTAYILALMCFVAFASCKRGPKEQPAVKEDRQAKAMLQGIWINQDDEQIAFSVEGDTIFYPDSTSLPAYFRIVGDTLEMTSTSVSKYKIVQQSPHLFKFKNINGDEVVLMKSENHQDEEDVEQFKAEKTKAIELNQRQLIKRDTVVFQSGERFHCYIQVNPTTYKVYKTVVNDDGVEVTNIYYDNTIHVSIFKDSRKIYGHDFRKAEFQAFLPERRIDQVVLSDVLYNGTDADGFDFCALIGVPDEVISYSIQIHVSRDGNVDMKLQQD